jgi:hypothetical protein
VIVVRAHTLFELFPLCHILNDIHVPISMRKRIEEKEKERLEEGEKEKVQEGTGSEGSELPAWFLCSSLSYT